MRLAFVLGGHSSNIDARTSTATLMRVNFQPICTPLSGFAKVTYMYGIIQTGNAEAVSLTTWSISIATNAGNLDSSPRKSKSR